MGANTLTTTEARELCAKRNKPMTSTGLIHMGCVHGFASKSEDGYHWIYDREGLLKYLKQKSTEVPRGWVPVSYLAKKYEISIKTIYYQIKKWNVLAIEFGLHQKMKHVNEKEFEKARIKHREVRLTDE